MNEKWALSEKSKSNAAEAEDMKRFTQSCQFELPLFEPARQEALRCDLNQDSFIVRFNGLVLSLGFCALLNLRGKCEIVGVGTRTI